MHPGGKLIIMQADHGHLRIGESDGERRPARRTLYLRPCHGIRAGNPPLV